MPKINAKETTSNNKVNEGKLVENIKYETNSKLFGALISFIEAYN